MRLTTTFLALLGLGRWNFVGGYGADRHGILKNFLENDSEILSGTGPAESHGLPTAATRHCDVEMLVEHLFNLFRGDPMLGDVLDVPFGIILKIPDDAQVGHASPQRGISFLVTAKGKALSSAPALISSGGWCQWRPLNPLSSIPCGP